MRPDRTKPRRILPQMVLTALIALGLSGAGGASARGDSPRTWHEASFSAMSTRVSLIVPPDSDAEAARAAVVEAFAEVAAEMNEWRAGSPLAAVNDAAGRAPVVVPADLFALVRRAVAIGELTHGAFDLTWAALWPLWRFGPTSEEASQPVVPAAADVAAKVALIDYRSVVLDEGAHSVFLPRRGMKIGLGGIAKGYALDRAASRLRALGIDAFLLDAGGQVLVRGERDGRPWRIGLRDPRGEGPGATFASIELADRSISTSGDYERFFVVDGVRYHHIIDPGTGWPSRGVISASAIAPDATLADALSTAFMVLGVERALAVVTELRANGQDVDAVLVDERGVVHASPGMRHALARARPIEVSP